MQGLTTDGSLSIDANSAVRRTCSLTMIAQESTFDVSNMGNLVALNKKMRLYVGMKNNVPGFVEKYGEIIWFPMGVFVLTNGSIRHDVSNNTISITAQDKMCLLNGEVGGVLSAPTDFASYDQILENGDVVSIYNTLFDIIRTAVIDLGQEDPSKVVILDLPDVVRRNLSVSNIGGKTYYINTANGQSSETNSWGPDAPVEIISLDQPIVGYEMIDFTVPSKELYKQAGDSVTSVLDEIIKLLGNYEYYYDIDGNFIFREIRNHLNTSPKQYYYDLNNDDYMANFDSDTVFYSFVGKQNVSAYSNTPDWLNIKNDFVVWGMKEVGEVKIPISYHVAIDAPPFFAGQIDGYYEGKPWQQELLEYEEALAADINGELRGTGLRNGPYYQELKAKWSQAYDNETRTWIDNPSYFLDFIDINSDIGKFSVDNIGRRTKVVVDENVKRLYPLYSPEIEIVNKFDNETDSDFATRINEEYVLRGVPFVNVYNGGVIKYSDLQGARMEKDAFGVVREMLFMHSTMNEVINISCLPLYNFEANVKIEAEDSNSDISGYYMVRSLNIPLSIEGQMSVSAIRANTRV